MGINKFEISHIPESSKIPVTKWVNEKIDTVNDGISKAVDWYNEIDSIIKEFGSYRIINGSTPTVGTGILSGFAQNISVDVPLYVKPVGETTFWKFPIDPNIEITGNKTLVKRSVANGSVRGTVKERWNLGDYTISITGVFLKEQKGNAQRDGSMYTTWNASENTMPYPYMDVAKLRDYLEAGRELIVVSPILTMFNIFRIVVEKLTIPYTRSTNSQTYTIIASSDNIFDLLIEEGKSTIKDNELTKSAEGKSIEEQLEEGAKEWAEKLKGLLK